MSSVLHIAIVTSAIILYNIPTRSHPRSGAGGISIGHIDINNLVYVLRQDVRWQVSDEVGKEQLRQVMGTEI